MYVSRLFVWDDQHDSGMVGWRMTRPAPQRFEGYEFVEQFTPTTDFGMVHDALEHFAPPVDGQELENEFMALGQTCFVRVETERLYQTGNNIPPPSWSIAGILADVLKDNAFNLHGYVLPKCPHAHRRNEWLEGFIDEMRDNVEKFARREIESDDNEEVVAEAIGMIPDMFDWMRHGYAKAARRWVKNKPASTGYTERAAQDEAAQLFWDTVYWLERDHKVAEPGDTLRIGFNLRRFTHSFTRGVERRW